MAFVSLERNESKSNGIEPWYLRSTQTDNYLRSAQDVTLTTANCLLHDVRRHGVGMVDHVTGFVFSFGMLRYTQMPSLGHRLNTRDEPMGHGFSRSWKFILAVQNIYPRDGCFSE